jgi:hypothetical protein
LWKSVAGRKLYLTGGIGADAATEGFGPDYALPNDSYNETCAAIGNALWNHRMFLLSGQAKFMDVVERVIHNGFLAGVGWSGQVFFYPNPLVSDGKSPFNIGACQRSPWFRCSCCPVNIVRFVPQVEAMIYASTGDSIFVNLYIGSRARFATLDVPVDIEQITEMPWNGESHLTLTPEKGCEFTVNLRIPGWQSKNPFGTDLYGYVDELQPDFSVTVNNEPVVAKPAKGYLAIKRFWRRGDSIDLKIELPIRRVAAHPKVGAAAGAIAIERGPLLYCAEGADNDGVVAVRTVDRIPTAEQEMDDKLLGGLMTIQIGSGKSQTKMIPYYAWCHRGPNEMKVWLPIAK